MLEDSGADSGFCPLLLQLSSRMCRVMGVGLENRARGQLLVRWYMLTSKPRGSAVYSTGES